MELVIENKNITQREFIEKINKIGADNITVLSCFYCKNLTTIPQLNLLKVLDCDTCMNLTTIPILKSLKVLYCYNCPNLKTIPQLNLLETLYCYNCPNLETIPRLNLLETLMCVNCPKLVNVGCMPKLIKIDSKIVAELIERRCKNEQKILALSGAQKGSIGQFTGMGPASPLGKLFYYLFGSRRVGKKRSRKSRKSKKSKKSRKSRKRKSNYPSTTNSSTSN